VSYDYLETKTGIETAVNGVYSTMRWYVGGERYYCLTEYGVDYVWEGADGGNKDAFNKYSNQFITGGFFSLDGIHPTPRASAIVANAFIKAINAQYGASVPLANVNDYNGVVFP
jgi:hypothetical protein